MRTIFVGFLGAIIGFALYPIAQRSDMAHTEYATSYQPSDYTSGDTYDYGSYESYDYVSAPCNDPIPLASGHAFCKEDQSIDALVAELRRANTHFADPGQSVLFWRFTSY